MLNQYLNCSLVGDFVAVKAWKCLLQIFNYILRNEKTRRTKNTYFYGRSSFNFMPIVPGALDRARVSFNRICPG